MNRWALGGVVACAILLGGSSSAEAVDRYVCAANTEPACGGAPFYATIQAAVTAASCGDTIYLAPELFELGSDVDFNNTVDCGVNMITVRSRGSDSLFPPPMTRLVPTVRRDGLTSLNGEPLVGNTDPANMARIRSNDVRTFVTGLGARGYRFLFLHFLGNAGGFGNIVDFGRSTGQEFASQQVRDMIIDRCLFEADAIVGQRLGVLMNGANLTIANSYFANFVSVGQDGQVFGGANGTGPVFILNNHIEGGTEGGIFGGGDPHMYTFVQTAAGSTTTQLIYNESSFRTLHSENAWWSGAASTVVGQHIAIQVSTSTSVERQFATVTAINTTTNTISIDADPETAGVQPIATAPVAGLDLRVGATYDGITVVRNDFVRQTRWRNPILSAPTGVSVTASTASGTIAAPGRYYKVTARNHDGYQGADYTSVASAEVRCELDAPGRCTVRWNPVPGATRFRVYTGTSTGGQDGYFDVTSQTGGVWEFIDTGSTIGRFTGTPATSGTVFALKNHFQLKQGKNGVIENNRFRYSWTSPAGSGISTWWKVVNQGGLAEYAQLKNIQIRYNVFEHVAACFTFSSQEEYLAGVENRPDKMSEITVEHNLCFDSGPGWVSGSLGAVTFAYTGPRNFRFRNNSIFHRTHSAVRFGDTDAPWPGTNPFTCNIFVHNNYGFESNAFDEGLPTINAFLGAANVTPNVITDSSLTYPPGTIEPSLTAFNAAFVNVTGASVTDYAIVANHPWRTGCTGGTTFGADIAALAARVDGVIEGTPLNAPFVTTAQLPGATRTVAYSFQLEAGGGNGSTKTWSLAPGSTLPTGVTLSPTGLLSATAVGFTAAAGTYTFTVRVADSAASGTRPLTLVVSSPAASITIQTPAQLRNGALGVEYSEQLAATGGNGNISWTWTGLLPTGVSLTSGGLLTGTPGQHGPFTFSATASDTAGQSASRQFTWQVADIGPNEPLDDDGRNDRWNGHGFYTWKSCQDLPSDPELSALERPQRRDVCLHETGDRLCVIIDPPTPTTPVTLDCYVKQTTETARMIALGSGSAETTIPDAPVGGKEYGAGTGTPYQRPLLDLRGKTEFRLVFYLSNISTVAGAQLRPEFSVNGGSSWAQLAATPDACSIDITTGLDTRKTCTVTAIDPLAAVENVELRLWQTTGDGADDTGFRMVYIEVR